MSSIDIIVGAGDGSGRLEIRNARVVDAEGRRGSLLRLHCQGELYRAHFWFEREDLQAFVREARWLVRSISGDADLGCLSLLRRGGEWKLAGRFLQTELLFSFPISMRDAERFVSACEDLICAKIAAD